MKRTIKALFATLAFLSVPALAQQTPTQPAVPLQWNVSGASGVTTATYPGNVVILGTTTNQGPEVQPLYTVATLPTCNAAAKGSMAAVTDATAPAYNGALTGGGAVVVPVFCNGSSWTAH